MVMVSPSESLRSPMTLPAEQRVVICGVTWQGYQQILTALPPTRQAQLMYDRGTLEITMPGFYGSLSKMLLMSCVAYRIRTTSIASSRSK